MQAVREWWTADAVDGSGTGEDNLNFNVDYKGEKSSL